MLYICIRCTTLLPPFFSEIRGFIVKNWLYIYDSKYCPSLASTFSHLSGSVRILRRKKWSSLRLSTNRSNFLLLHKTGSAGQPGRVPLIETNDSQREQRLENTAGGVGLPISTFPSMSWPLSQHGVEHCHAAKSLYRVSLYCGRLSFNARLKRINCVRYRSPVIVSVGFNSS